MDLSKALLGLQQNFAFSKLDKLLRKAAEISGKSFEDYFDENFGDNSAIFVKDIPTNSTAALISFKKEVGDEIWSSIALNPALPSMIDKHVQELKQKAFVNLHTYITEKLKDAAAELAVEFAYEDLTLILSQVEGE